MYCDFYIWNRGLGGALETVGCVDLVVAGSCRGISVNIGGRDALSGNLLFGVAVHGEVDVDVRADCREYDSVALVMEYRFLCNSILYFGSGQP